MMTFLVFTFLIGNKRFHEYLGPYINPVQEFWSYIPDLYHFHGKVALSTIAFILFVMSRFWSKTKSRLTRKQKQILNEQRSYILSHVKPQKEKLYGDYLKQSVADHDLS